MFIRLHTNIRWIECQPVICMQIGCFDVDVYVHFRKESSEMVLILLLFYVKYGSYAQWTMSKCYRSPLGCVARLSLELIHAL
jgi:hypothetical protein